MPPVNYTTATIPIISLGPTEHPLKLSCVIDVYNDFPQICTWKRPMDRI